MTYIALVDFIGIVNGAEVSFAKGAEIGAAAAREMNLAQKPDLAKAAK